MRLGRLGAQVRPADLDEDDWLAAFRRELGYLDEFAGVFESFHESSDHFGVIVIQQVTHEIREIQVGLVAR